MCPEISPGIPTGFAALIALRIAQPVRLNVQKRVQCLLHAATHHPVEMAFDPLIINRDDIAQWTRCSLCHGGSFLLSWLRFATSSSARFGAAALTKCAKHSLRHRDKRPPRRTNVVHPIHFAAEHRNGDRAK